MTKQVSRAVEAIKLAYLSHSPVVWLVTGDKEVASDIVKVFVEEHFGSFRSAETGSRVNLSQYSGQEIKKLAKDGNKLLKEYGDMTLKEFFSSNLKALPKEPSDSSRRPSIFYSWKTITSEDKELFESIEEFVTVHSLMIAASNVWCKAPEHINAVQLSLVIIASPSQPPKSWLSKYIEVINVEALHSVEIQETIINTLSSKGISLQDKDMNYLRELVVNLRGSSVLRITNAILRCIALGYFDYDAIQWSKILREIRGLKRQLLEGFVGLKWIDLEDKKISDIVHNKQANVSESLAIISKWMDDRKEIFKDTERARKMGYDIPKGVLITGIPGTGKSMMAKETAKRLDLPLIALDMGDLLEGHVGESEKHMVEALRMVEAMAPCVLWIDEIEKAFSGSNSGSSDGGVMRRMFGKFLTWMQEKTTPCFVFATSNDISELPPELFRSERFDDKFFSFMPMVDECAAIFSNLIKDENSKFEQNNPDDDEDYMFAVELTEKEKWKKFLNEYTEGRGLGLMDGNRWSGGKVPQYKLLTGADISMVVKLTKFKLLKDKDKEHIPLPFPKDLVEKTVKAVLDDFMPYGQTNLRNIANCFVLLSHNRFKSASETSVVNFDDYNIETAEMSYDPDRYKGDAYDRALYAAVVGAINFYSDEEKRSKQHIVKHENC